MPTWLNLQGPELALHASFNAHVYAYVRRNKPNTAILPVLQNASARPLGRNRALRGSSPPHRGGHHVAGVAAFVRSASSAGPDHRLRSAAAGAPIPIFACSCASSSSAFAPHGWTVALAAPFDDDKWPFADYAQTSITRC